MNSKRIGYIVFMFILFTIFSGEVKAAPANVLGREDAKEMSCAYYDDKEAYKLVQKKDGSIIIYSPEDGKVSSVVSEEENFSWSGVWKEENREIKEFDSYDAGVDQIYFKDLEKSLTKCPKALLVSNRTFGFYPSFDESLEEKHKNSTINILEFKGKIDKVVNNSSSVINNSYEPTYKSCSEIGSVDEMWLNKNLGTVRAGCLYSFNTGNKQCIIVQLDIGVDGSLSVHSNYSSSINTLDSNTLASEFNDNYIRENGGWCPNLWIKKSNANPAGLDNFTALSMNGGASDVWFQMDFVDQKGKNLVDSSVNMSEHNYEGPNIVFLDNSFSCSDIENGRIGDLLKFLFNLIKIIVPVLLIVFGCLDFVSAIFSGDDGNMKKAQAKFIKRVVIAVGIFLVPSILKLLLTVAGTVWPSISADLCGILD